MKKYLGILAIIVVTIGVTLAFSQHSTAPGSDDKNKDTDTNKQDSGTSLVYASRGLSDFPKEILNKTNAVELDLSGNSLQGSLPAEIKNLSKLEILNVSNNDMSGIPAEIGQMTKLRVINYANNRITGLPNELGNLKNLEILDLRGNNPSQQDLESIKAKLPNTTQILL